MLDQLACEVGEDDSTKELKVLELKKFLKHHEFLVKPRTGKKFCCIFRDMFLIFYYHLTLRARISAGMSENIKV